MARLRFVRKKSPQGVGRLTTAFGLFLILCGLVLLLAGRGMSCRLGPQEDLVNNTRSALLQARQAERALQRNNFGTALSAVQGLQEELERVLSALNASPEATGQE